jgi:hypothetical protein
MVEGLDVWECRPPVALRPHRMIPLQQASTCDACMPWLPRLLREELSTLRMDGVEGGCYWYKSCQCSARKPEYPILSYTWQNTYSEER